MEYFVCFGFEGVVDRGCHGQTLDRYVRHYSRLSHTTKISSLSSSSSASPTSSYPRHHHLQNQHCDFFHKNMTQSFNHPCFSFTWSIVLFCIMCWQFGPKSSFHIYKHFYFALQWLIYIPSFIRLITTLDVFMKFHA